MAVFILYYSSKIAQYTHRCVAPIFPTIKMSTH